MLTLRDATLSDAAEIVAMIRELADYEQLLDRCKASEENIRGALFSPHPKVFCTIAEWEGKAAAFALYFYNFSTFRTQHGIYLEDLFVRPEFRRKGIAKALFTHLAQKVVREGCGRLDWQVLDWNEDALRFYASLGAVSLKEWVPQRLEGEALHALAAQA